MKTQELASAQRKPKWVSSVVRNKYMYLLLLPALIFVIIFNYLPLSGIMIAFKDYDVLKGFAKSEWVGLEHFKNILQFPNFLNAIKNTLIYSAVCLFGQFPFPILLAIMINEVRSSWFKRSVQTISYLPHFLSWVSVIGFAYSIFSLTGSWNDLMRWIHGGNYEASNLLFDSSNFIGVLFFSGLWKDIGWSSIIYLAAICGVDQSLYEAAAIDGAGRLKRIWYITLPAIKTTAVLILIMNIGNLVKNNFEQVYGFQNVYIQNDTDVIGTLSYREGIQGGNYSMATAFGLAQGLVSFILVIITNWISKKISDVGIW